MKKLGIVRRETKKLIVEELFNKYFHNEYKVGFFHWQDVKKNIATKVRETPTKNYSNVPLKDFDIIYINTLGSIKDKMDSFLPFLRNLKNLPKVINDPETFEYNLDKKYLLFLQEKGIQTIQTKEISGIDYSELLRMSFNGIEEIVLKPRMFGERMKGVIKRSDLKSEEDFQKYQIEHGKNILIQPYLKEIITKGERSLIFVGNNFSHAIWRYRENWKSNPCGKYEQVKPTKKELKIAENTLSVWPKPYHITRFDFVMNKGEPFLSEVEMGNPNIWLEKENVGETFMNLFYKHVEKLM